MKNGFFVRRDEMAYLLGPRRHVVAVEGGEAAVDQQQTVLALLALLHHLVQRFL